jgi:hypothetical protein
MNKVKREDEDLESSKMGLVDGEIHHEKDKVTGDPVKPQSTKGRIVDMLCILLNIASTVTLVFLNKWYPSKICAWITSWGRAVLTVTTGSSATPN